VLGVVYDIFMIIIIVLYHRSGGGGGFEKRNRRRKKTFLFRDEFENALVPFFRFNRLR